MGEDLDVTDDPSQTSLSREDVEQRIDDWRRRLNAFFLSIGSWAKDSGWQISDDDTVTMRENLMERFGIPATQQPTLRLDRVGSYALFKPKGLWVIGANGRVDLYTSKGVYIILDLAEHGTTPRWTIFRTTSKSEGAAFEPEMLADLT